MTVAASAASTNTDPSNGVGTSPSTVTTVVGSTAVVPAAGFELRVDGLGDLNFGTAPDVVIETISATLGAALIDHPDEFRAAVGGSFQNDETSQAFMSPFGRTVCWPGLCAQFGGDDPSALSFVGWDRFADPAASTVPLAAADGVTLGSRWSDFLDVMIVQPGGCPTSGSGSTTGGIELALQGQFSTQSDSGEYVELLPDPSQVTVVAMGAGSRVVSLEEDC